MRPSTPAVLAPLLPRTRSQATSKERGIGDKVEQVIEPAMRIITGPTVQLGLDPQYPALRPAQWRTPVRRYSPARPPGSSRRVHCRLAGPLRHVRAINALGLLRGLRHVLGPSADDGPALRLAGCQAGRAAPGRFPRSPPSGRRASRPALPRQHRRAYAAGFQRGLPAGIKRPASESPPGDGVRCTRPISSRLEPVEKLRGFRHWFLSYGVSSCLPDPRRLEVPARPVVVRAAPTLARVSTFRLPSASPACCDRPAAGVFHPRPVNSGASWRTLTFFQTHSSGLSSGE